MTKGSNQPQVRHAVLDLSFERSERCRRKARLLSEDFMKSLKGANLDFLSSLSRNLGEGFPSLKLGEDAMAAFGSSVGCESRVEKLCCRQFCFGLKTFALEASRVKPTSLRSDAVRPIIITVHQTTKS
jgi:hypothetical protein